MANEYLGECHALCFIENRKGTSQIFPKIEEFIQFFYFLAKLGIKIQLHPFWLKQVIWQNALLDLIRAMFMKMAVTQLIMGLSEKFFRLHYPQTPLYQEDITISYLPKGPDRMGCLFENGPGSQVIVFKLQCCLSLPRTSETYYNELAELV